MALLRFLPLFFSFSALAAAPAGETWFTMATPHFRVHHTAALETYARAYAAALERARPKLEKNLRWPAPRRMDIVVTDPSDSANGFAMNFPSTRMEIYAVPFEGDSPLGYYHDWVDELATHELTHLIANDTTTGAYPFLRSIFGSWIRPNGLQPVWLIEGLAVYQETSLTTAGRGRSPWTDSLLREAYTKGQLGDPSYLSLDRLNDGNPWWPGGSTSYLLGYAIQASANREHPGLPGDISLANSRKIPFMPDSTAEGVTGKDWQHHWSQLPTRLANRYGSPIPGATEPCWITSGGRYTGGQALAPDGWVYFSEEDFHYGFRLSRVRWDAPCGAGTKPERLVHREHASPAQVAVSASGALVAYSVIDHQSFERFFSDIHLWHTDTGWHEQVTQGARGRDPAFLGEILHYVKQNPDTSQSIVSFTNGRETPLFTSRPLERISGLSGQGSELLFSLHNNQGQERIFSLPHNGGTPTALVEASETPEFQRNPYRASDGSLYFASRRGQRAQEIHRQAPGAKASAPIARAASGLVDRPIPLPSGELLVSAYGLAGINLARLPVSKLTELPAATDLHETLSGETSPAPPPSVGANFGPSEPYSPLRSPATSLLPQYWLPELTTTVDGLLIGASTAGNDALDYHQYGLLAQYDTRARFPHYRAHYRNRTYPVTFHFEARQRNNYFSSSQSSNRNTIYSAEAIAPLGATTFYGMGAAFQEQFLFNRKTQSAIFLQNFTYSDLSSTPAAMEANHGASFRAYVGLHPNARNESVFLDIRPKASVHFRGFRPSHSLAIKAAAGISTNSLLASSYYLGGGLGALVDTEFVVRGYPVDSLFGQRVATINASYTLPIAQPFRGLGTNPVFLESLGLRFLADAGSANFLAEYSGRNFRRYRPQSLGARTLTGGGIDLLAKGSVFYHVPLTVAAGFHYGFQREFGGGPVFYLGLSAGLLGELGQGGH